MAYPEKLLADDEKVVEHLHPHWVTLVAPVAWFLLICGGRRRRDRNYRWGHAVLLIVVAVIGLALFVWLVLTKLIEWRSSHYVFTTHRVLIRRGVLHHTGRDIALQRISDVAFSQTLWDRIVKAGTITIESAGEHGQETLVNLPRANEVQQTLNRLIEADSTRRGQYQPGGQPPGPGPARRPTDAFAPALAA